jgi:hypothetical protein
MPCSDVGATGLFFQAVANGGAVIKHDQPPIEVRIKMAAE